MFRHILCKFQELTPGIGPPANPYKRNPNLGTFKSKALLTTRKMPRHNGNKAIHPIVRVRAIVISGGFFCFLRISLFCDLRFAKFLFLNYYRPPLLPKMMLSISRYTSLFYFRFVIAADSVILLDSQMKTEYNG